VARIVVLASGSGSNLQAIIDACAVGRIGAEVVGVVTNVKDAYALSRAQEADIATQLLERLDGEQREDYDTRLAHSVAEFEPDFVVLAGWMRLLTMNFLGRFPNQVVNLHPALPGQLPGVRAIERAWDEALAGNRLTSGVMVHFVPDEGVDDGPVLASREIPIDTSGTLDAFASAVHATEHELLVDTLIELCCQT
jgi:phosphoribosylglycinamide formyltransferase-1